jgi:uncharacterized protein YidB (DUF937 family)
MGLLDEITKAVGVQNPLGSGQEGLMDQVMGLINNPETGGLTGLVEKFNSQGLGDAVSSWISTGENQAVSGEQVQQAFGSDAIQNVAQKLGISGTDVSSGLAALLPKIIDGLTPDGKIPEGGLLDQGLDFLKNKILGS